MLKPVKISLAGDLGSGKSTVGKLLAKIMNAQVYSTGTFQRKIAGEMHMTTLQLNRYMETHPEIDGWIDDGVRSLEFSTDNLIIDSRMAWHFVPSSFSVYMAADAYVSADRILKAGRQSEPFSSVEEAAASIADRRGSEAQRYLRLYGVDIQNLENYDYVIDTSYITPETAAERIMRHYMFHEDGIAYPRYDLCAARLLPCLQEEGEPAFFERGGFYFIARGAEAVARAVKAGEELIACSREDAAADAEMQCTPAKIEAWERETGIRFPKLPAFARR